MADNIKERLATDETLKHLVQGVDAIATALSGSSKAVLDETFAAMLDGENTTATFHHWWKLAREQDSEADRYETLCRWFAMLGEAWAGKFYTLRGPDWRVNATGDTELTPMGDLAGKAAAGCYTEESPIAAEWCDEDPMTWYVRANALMNEDGSASVLAVEGVDNTFDVTGFLAPVQVFRLALWRTWYTDGVYEYKTFATEPHGAMRPYAANVAPDGTARVCHWMPAFGGSLIQKNSKTCLTSGAGNAMAWKIGATTGLTDARNMGAYEGLMSDTDIEVLLDQWQLRHHNLENSGILEGCLNYNFQYVVAAAEEGATSVLLTTAQAATLYAGSGVCLGSHPAGTNNDRATAANSDLVAWAEITEIETVTIEGNEYARVHLGIAEGVDVPATALISTMPWATGSTEKLPDRKDGSLHSCTAGMTPARIAGVECIDGANAIGLDPLWVEDYDASRNPKNIYTVYAVRKNNQQAASAGVNHVLIDTFECNGTGYNYYKHFRINDHGMLIPEGFGSGTGSTTFMKSAFYFGASSGARAPWRFYDLTHGAYGGLAGAHGYLAPSSASWGGRPRLSGAGGMRGEWAA